MSDLKGYKELSAKLKSLQAKETRKIVRRGTGKMAQVVRKEMRRDAPKKSGNLRKNIRYKIKRLQSGGFVARVGLSGKGFYGSFIEYGAKPHSITSKDGVKTPFGVKKQINHPGVKAKPFIKPGFDRGKRKAVKEAGELMFQLIKAAF